MYFKNLIIRWQDDLPKGAVENNEGGLSHGITLPNKQFIIYLYSVSLF